MISCKNNSIYVNKTDKIIYSEHEIKRLYIEIQGVSYYLYCEPNKKGDKCLKLDSIPSFYRLETYKGTVLPNNVNKGYYSILRENDLYIITNCSLGDAGVCRISFKTDNNGNLN